MEFRSILFVFAFLMAVIGSFGFKNNDKRQFNEANYFFPTHGCFTGSTEQVPCTTTNTGAQCTILVNGTHYPAWQWMSGPVKNCTVPLKRLI
jgi:hypothetical protein